MIYLTFSRSFEQEESVDVASETFSCSVYFDWEENGCKDMRFYGVGVVGGFCCSNADEKMV